MLGVGDGITDDTLEEGLENGASLLVDHCGCWLAGVCLTREVGGIHTGRDTLDTTTTSETSDSGLGDTLDVVTKNLAVALSTALAETLYGDATVSHKL